MNPEQQRSSAWYPNRDGTTWDGLRVDGPRVKLRRPQLVRHPDHVCPDGTRITGISAQHLARDLHLARGGITLWRGRYAHDGRPVHFPVRFGDRRADAPDTTDLDHQHRHIGRAAA